MATNGGEAEQHSKSQIGKTLKEGERILAPTRRPDGTFRKEIRIRAGYNPPDEVPLYQSKGVLLRKAMPTVPPGYDPVSDVKPKTKASKRNERKKEKKQQSFLEKGKDIGHEEAGKLKTTEAVSPKDGNSRSEVIESVASQMRTLLVSENSTAVVPLPDSTDSLNTGTAEADIDKRIRALKKKIRLAEAQQQKAEKAEMKPQLLEKLAKLEEWRKELRLLEEKKAESPAS